MYSLLKKLVSILLIPAVLPYLVQGQVLCNSHNGHIALEPAIHSHCDHEHPEEHNNSEVHTGHYSLKDCVSCEDIRIDNNPDNPHPNGNTANLSNLPEFFFALPDCLDIDFKSFNYYTFFTPLKIIVLLT